MTRLRVKRDAAERLREILRARTARLADVLEAERELSRVVGEIEQAEGERRFYDQQLALSTLTVELREPRAPVESGAFDALGEAWSRTCEVLASSLAVMVYALAALAPWVLVGLGLWRALRAWRARL